MGLDPREGYYERRLAEDSQAYVGYDRSVCELSLNLVYTFDLFEGIVHESLQSFGISLPAFNLLKILWHHENKRMPQNEIGELLLTSRANVTGLVDGLVKKGLVDRVPHPTDRRVKLACLLPQGEEFLTHLMPVHIDRLNTLFQATTSTEREQLVTLLKKVRMSFKRAEH